MPRLSPLCVLCALCAFAFDPIRALAQNPFDPAARAAAIAPLVDDQTIAVAHVDLDRINASEIAKLLGEIVPPGEPSFKAQLPKLEQAIKGLQTAFRAGGIRELYAVVSLHDFPKEPVFLVAPLAADAEPGASAEMLRELTRLPEAATIGKVAVAGQPKAIARLKAHRPTPRPDLAKAFALAGDTAAQAIIAPTDDTRRVIREILPQLPDEIGGGSGAVIADGFRWAVLSINAPPKLSLNITVQAKDEASAAALRGIALSANQQLRDRLLQSGGNKPTEREAAEALVTLFTPRQKGDQLIISHIENEAAFQRLAHVLLPALQSARTAHGRTQSTNNLKQLGIAMHNFHDVYKHLPPQAIRGKDGRALLSWRVALLPYLNENDLYQQFRLDEPWDSEHNKQLIPRMPPLLASPHLGADRIAKGLTSYVVPLSKAPPAVWLVMPDDPTKPTSGKDEMIFDIPQGTTMGRITDGTSNTILLLEAISKAAVTWTKPEDLVIDPNAPFAQLAGQPSGGISAVIADASVHFIRTSLDVKTFWNLLRMNDGNTIGEF